MISATPKSIRQIVILFVFIALFGFAISRMGSSAQVWNGPGLAFIILGGIATTLMGFRSSGIGAAFRDTTARSSADAPGSSARFWQAAARNFWILGVLASVASFVLALGSSEGGITEITSRMAHAFLPVIYGLILSTVCMAPALKLETAIPAALRAEESALEPAGEVKPSGRNWETPVGYLLFAGALAWILLESILKLPLNGPLHPLKTLFHGPALLVVGGGTLILALFIGRTMEGWPLTWSLALTGFIGAMIGEMQALLGFSMRSIQMVASGASFALSSCFLALLGMLLLGNPIEDRSVTHGGRSPSAASSRTAWLAFPLATLIILAITFVMVITPMKKGG